MSDMCCQFNWLLHWKIIVSNKKDAGTLFRRLLQSPGKEKVVARSTVVVF